MSRIRRQSPQQGTGGVGPFGRTGAHAEFDDMDSDIPSTLVEFRCLVRFLNRRESARSQVAPVVFFDRLAEIAAST